MPNSYHKSSDNKDKYYYIITSIKPNKDKKNYPNNPINKHVNKYNKKNKHYYNPTDQSYVSQTYTYIANSDVYIDKI